MINKRYFIRQELVDFVNRGFKTPEDYRFEKSNMATWIGISISLLIGIISVWLGIKSSNSSIKLNDE